MNELKPFDTVDPVNSPCSGIQDDLTSPKDLPLRSHRNETERVKERRINKEETKHLNRMDWIFLHLFKKDPYTLSLFLGTISGELLTEIQPDSAVLLIRALRGRPHARTHTGVCTQKYRAFM